MEEGQFCRGLGPSHRLVIRSRTQGKGLEKPISDYPGEGELWEGRTASQVHEGSQDKSWGRPTLSSLAGDTGKRARLQVEGRSWEGRSFTLRSWTHASDVGPSLAIPRALLLVASPASLALPPVCAAFSHSSLLPPLRPTPHHVVPLPTLIPVLFCSPHHTSPPTATLLLFR